MTRAAALLAALALAAPATAQLEALHSVKFEIHDSLVGAGPGQMSLADWQDFVDEALLQARTAIQGDQGPADTACCTNLERSTALTTFSGDFATIDTPQEFTALRNQEGAGAYIIDSLEVCGNTIFAGFLGCADTPGDFLVVDLDDPLSLGLTIAHELGHNTGLLHPEDRMPPLAADPCVLMSSSNGGGCLPAADCQSFVDDADATGAECECLGGVQGPAVADGSACTFEAGCGLCSGGMCGACTSEAAGRLFAAGDPTSDGMGTPTTLLAGGTLTGGFASVGAIGAALNGLAYDASRDVLWGIRDGSPDQLVHVDPATGAITNTVGGVGNPAAQDLEALAYDPNGDVLYAIETTASAFGFNCPPGSLFSVLRTVDPDSPATSTRLGAVQNFVCLTGIATGLAWDSQNDALWLTYGLGLMLVDPGDCTGVPPECSVDLFQYEEMSGGPFSGFGIDLVEPSAIAYEPTSGRVFKVGLGAGVGGLPLLEVIDAGTGNPVDADTGALRLLMGTDGFTIGGLAAVPVPEPSAGTAAVIALAAAVLLVRLRR